MIQFDEHIFQMGWNHQLDKDYFIGFLRVSEVFLGNTEDSIWEDWGTLGKIRGITNPP